MMEPMNETPELNLAVVNFLFHRTLRRCIAFMTFVIFFNFILFIIAKKCFNLYLQFKKQMKQFTLYSLNPYRPAFK